MCQSFELPADCSDYNLPGSRKADCQRVSGTARKSKCLRADLGKRSLSPRLLYLRSMWCRASGGKYAILSIDRRCGRDPWISGPASGHRSSGRLRTMQRLPVFLADTTKAQASDTRAQMNRAPSPLFSVKALSCYRPPSLPVLHPTHQRICSPAV